MPEVPIWPGQNVATFTRLSCERYSSTVTVLTPRRTGDTPKVPRPMNTKVKNQAEAAQRHKFYTCDWAVRFLHPSRKLTISARGDALLIALSRNVFPYVWYCIGVGIE